MKNKLPTLIHITRLIKIIIEIGKNYLLKKYNKRH